MNARIAGSTLASAKLQATAPYVQAKLDANAGATMDGSVKVFFGPLDSLEFETYIGGNGGVSYHTSNYIDDFRDMKFNATYGYNAHIVFSTGWGSVRVHDKSYDVQCTYPYNGSYSCVGQRVSSQCSPDGEWTPHSTSPTYATFSANGAGPQAFADELAAASPVVSPFVSDVYGHTRVSLAVNQADNHALQVWTHDDPAKPLGGSHEIVYSLWNGAIWTSPKPITDDLLLDEAAQVAWTSDGKALALWHRFTQPQTAVSTSASQQVELAYAIYDPRTDTWTAPALLTSNNALDMAGVLARNASGQLMATWGENEGGQAIGTSEQPTRIMAAFFDGVWSTPQVVLDDADSLMDLVGGLGDGRAAIAFTKAISQTDGTDMIRNMFVSAWDGQAWSAPLPIANDGSDHDSPNLLFTADNQPVVIWTDRHIIRQANLETGFQTTAPLAPENGSIDLLRILPDQAGNLVAVFRQTTGEATIAVSLFDRALGLWSAPRPLSDGGMAGIHAEALTSDGRLLVSYATNRSRSDAAEPDAHRRAESQLRRPHAWPDRFADGGLPLCPQSQHLSRCRGRCHRSAAGRQPCHHDHGAQQRRLPAGQCPDRLL